jgi:hypothetical protein
MSNLHLLYWIYKYLEENFEDVLKEMLANFDDGRWQASATKTRRQSLNDTYNLYKRAKEKNETD